MQYACCHKKRKRMTAKISDYKDVLYTRDYANDHPPQTNVLTRTAFAAIPFLSLHKPLRFPLSIVMGSLRLWNTRGQEDFFKTTMAMTALAAGIFKHRFGMVLTTIQDIVMEIKKIPNGKNKEEVTKSLVKVFSHLIYLALISRGGLELSLIAFVMQ